MLMDLGVSACAGQEDWGRGVWGDLRGSGHGDKGVGSTETGVRQAGQAGAQDGGGSTQETAR